MNVKLISITQPAFGHVAKTPEDLMIYCARVSSPENQENLDTGAKLLKYCIKNGHWSVLEQVSCTFEIETTRAISAQILRHQLKFQEFSLRYSKAVGFETYEARRQDTKNRQNSLDDMGESDREWFKNAQAQVWDFSHKLYSEALGRGVAKELARVILPMNTKTRLYATGPVRNWIHYLEARRAVSTQKEHRDIANAIWQIFKIQFPIVAEALAWE